ncbi:MAG: YIP1 family protein [Candidatus Altiarchaeota archaeon]
MELHPKELVNDLITLLNPKTTEKFFRNVRIKPVDEMLTYLLFFGLFTFFGYFLRHLLFVDKVPPFTAFSIALPYYLIGIVPSGVFSIFVMSYTLYLFGEKIVKRTVSREEALTVIGYSSIPELIGGFFMIISETHVLYLLLTMYSVLLLYIGIKSRFGFRFSVRCFAFVLISGFIFSMILFRIVLAIFTALNIPSAYYGL